MSVIGIVAPFLAYPKTEGLLALILLAIGGFFVNRKVRMVKNGSYILRYGMKTEAEITRISNTNLEHNNRTVKEYIFQYVANGRTHHYEYRSAFRRYLKEGDSMAIFYLEDDPKMAFIPRLYNLRIK
ncbi:MAG: hypothetical protein R8G66_28445 [Cytophagales bacterium]|nr:hypothetical protein [Cytophagales bacterium]